MFCLGVVKKYLSIHIDYLVFDDVVDIIIAYHFFVSFKLILMLHIIKN